MVDSPMWPSTIPSSVISGGGAGDDRRVGRGDDAGRGLIGDREELVGRGRERHDAGVGPEDPERHQLIAGRAPELTGPVRSEERRDGKEGVSTCRSRWTQYH